MIFVKVIRASLRCARWSDVANDNRPLAIAANRHIGHWPKVLEAVGVEGE